jgi:hypothetical protein
VEVVVVILGLVLLARLWPRRRSGYFVSTDEVAGFALKMGTRIGRLETLLAQKKMSAEVTEACIETICDVNDFVVSLVEGE